MQFDFLAWLFVAAVAVHNLEEALLLPAWTQKSGRWLKPLGGCEFRFAVICLTGLAALLALLAAIGSGHAMLLLCGFALAMAFNALAPHTAVSILCRCYMPGTASGLLLVLPAALSFLHSELTTGRVAWGDFVWAGPLTALTLAASIPLLLATGRRFCLSR